LRPEAGAPKGVSGAAWQVRGGGFYHMQKYGLAPQNMPPDLTWFKWESYATWLSGMGLLGLVYYWGADLFLLDPRVADMPVWAGIALSAGSLLLGWFAYDRACRATLGRDALLIGIVWGMILVMGWFYTQVFSARAAMLHLGAFTATIMSANVFALIIPNQKIVVADLIAGRSPDPRLGAAAKQRSLHNNYLTLPVIVLMVSNHYPLFFDARWNWLMAALLFPMGALIRHWFNSHHARRGNPWWTWPAAAAVGAAIIWLSALGPVSHDVEDDDAAALHGAPEAAALAAGFADVTDIVAMRCTMCHAETPLHPHFAAPPRGLVFDTPEQVARAAERIYLSAGRTGAMPPANISFMEPAERARIRAWFEGIGKTAS